MNTISGIARFIAGTAWTFALMASLLLAAVPAFFFALTAVSVAQLEWPAAALGLTMALASGAMWFSIIKAVAWTGERLGDWY